VAVVIIWRVMIDIFHHVPYLLFFYKLTFIILKKNEINGHLLAIALIIPFALFNFSAFMNSFIPIFNIDIEDREVMFYVPFFMEYVFSIPYMLAYRKYVNVK